MMVDAILMKSLPDNDGQDQGETMGQNDEDDESRHVLLRVRDASYSVRHGADAILAAEARRRGREPSGEGRIRIFGNLGLDVLPGEIVDLTGPSGCGKSSFLETIARLRENGRARLWLDGRPAEDFSPEQWRRQVAYVGQKPILVGDSVEEALLYPWTLAINRSDGASPRPSEKELRAALDGVGLGDVELDRETTSLSGGQLARVSLLRTCLTRPRVLLADEIDAALDQDSAIQEGRFLQGLTQKYGMAALRVRHRAPDGFASRTLVLDHSGLHPSLSAPDQKEEN